VVDDPLVNAFALPGGYIYVTRGILSHFNSEAEMASVLGHEIGHVTARHSVNQMSKAQLASIALGAGMLVMEDLQALGGAGPQHDQADSLPIVDTPIAPYPAGPRARQAHGICGHRPRLLKR